MAGVPVTRVLRCILMILSAPVVAACEPLTGRMLKLNLRGNCQRSAFRAASRFTVPSREFGLGSRAEIDPRCDLGDVAASPSIRAA